MQNKGKPSKSPKPPLPEDNKLKQRIKKLTTEKKKYRQRFIESYADAEKAKKNAKHWENEYYRVLYEDLLKKKKNLELMIISMERGLPMDLVNQWQYESLLN